MKRLALWMIPAAKRNDLTSPRRSSVTIATRSANGMSVTTVSDPYGLGWNYTQSTDVKTINANGSTTEMLTDANSNGSKRDKTVTTISANGLSTTTTYNLDGAGVELSTTDITTINADGSKTEVVTDYTGAPGGTRRGAKMLSLAATLLSGPAAEICIYARASLVDRRPIRNDR